MISQLVPCFLPRRDPGGRRVTNYVALSREGNAGNDVGRRGNNREDRENAFVRYIRDNDNVVAETVHGSRGRVIDRSPNYGNRRRR